MFRLFLKFELFCVGGDPLIDEDKIWVLDCCFRPFPQVNRYEIQVCDVSSWLLQNAVMYSLGYLLIGFRVQGSRGLGFRVLRAECRGEVFI